MNNFLYFLKNAIFSGIIIGLVMLFLNKKYSKLGGLLYGAIPFGFIYIMFAIYCESGKRDGKLLKLLTFSKFASIGLFLALIYLLTYYFSLKYIDNFFISTILFFVVIILSIPLIKKIYYISNK